MGRIIIRKANGDVVIKADKKQHKSHKEDDWDSLGDICDGCDSVDDWCDKHLGVVGLLSRAVTLPVKGMFGAWMD
jgi:hypothetical protein